MNKKVSTLVAALMAAGALVLPKDVFAQVQYANKGNYDGMTTTTKVSAGNYYLLIHDKDTDKDYVAVVNESKLEAVEFDEANPNNVQIKLAGSSKNGWTISSLAGDELNTDTKGQKWATPSKTTNNLWSISSTKDESVTIQAKVESTGRYLAVPTSNFGAFTFKASETNITAKLVKVDSEAAQIEAQEEATDAISTGSALDLSKGYVLFRGDEVLEGLEGGKAEWAKYDSKEQAQIWNINVIDDQTGEARFVNVETGELLRLADGTTPATITLDGDKTNGWKVPAVAIEGLIEEGVTVTISFGVTQEIGVNATELNKHFNGKGFNFAADKDLADVTVDGDLFGGDTRIFAFTITSKSGYKLNSKNEHGQDIVIPAGTYFFTDPVFLNGMGAAEVDQAKKPENIDWLKSTLIAVSSVSASEATDSDRRVGEGFDLIEVKGSEFDIQSNNEKPQGDDLDFKNACFTVTKDYNSKYALDAIIYYQPESDYEDTDEQKTAAIHLAVESYGKTTQRLVSQLGNNKYVFSLASTSVQDGRLLLNDTETAAVYTIQIVEGPKGYEDFEDKYLTVGATTSGSFQWEAKGAAIAEESFPAFQFVITDVKGYDKASEKYKTVVFTNRETGKSFETSLFPEGDMQFSLSTDQLEDVVAYTVKTDAQNTYQVEAKDTKDITSDIIVELKKVDVDQYAGFYNVEDGTIRTMAFARDKNDTSNKLYASVESLANNKGYKLNDNDEFTNEIANAAQWKLMKADSAQISRTFAYNKSATESVDYVADGDKLTAYVYALRYVEDGTETDYFLANDPKNLAKVEDIEESKDLEDASNFDDVNFIVKENVDGSISLIDADDAFLSKSPRVADADVTKAVEVKLNNKKYSYDFNTEDVYQSTSGTNDIRTYLDPEYAEISWPGNEGHVTMQGQLGDYITMNDDHDAIIVDENNADTYYLYVTDKDAVIPSFYITRGVGSTDGERMFMFNPVDSVNYYVAEGTFNKKYQWTENTTKVLFKSGIINETRDTLTLTVKGEADKQVAMKADDNNKNVWGGLNRFKFQIVESDDMDGYYYVRQVKSDNKYAVLTENNKGDVTSKVVDANYLSNNNDKATWSDKAHAMLFAIEGVEAPTANEGVSATEVKVIAVDGAINIKNAAGKNVVVSTILGQIVANEVLTSDNATISVPAGIAIVSVDGEEAVKVSVR